MTDWLLDFLWGWMDDLDGVNISVLKAILDDCMIQDQRLDCFCEFVATSCNGFRRVTGCSGF